MRPDSQLKRFVRDPIFHFMVLGILMFGIYNLYNSNAATRTVNIDSATISQMKWRWQKQWGRDPNQSELTGLVNAYVREEILAREAVKLRLDQDDPIIRRRLAQKMEFVLSDALTSEAIDPLELRSFYTANEDLFASTSLFDFSHIYLSTDKHKDAKTLAQSLFDRVQGKDLTTTDVKGFSDYFADGYSLNGKSPSQVDRVFGDGFSKRISVMPVGQWSGPVRSGLGWHLLYPRAYSEPTVPEFEDVRLMVEQRYLEQKSQELKQREYEKVRMKYTISVPEIE